MTSIRTNAFRRALSSASPKFVLLQWICFLILALLSMAWLQMPDSHVWQFALSVVIALALAFAFLALLAESFRWLRKPESTSRLWLRAVWIALFIGLWFLLQKPIGIGREHEGLYAGFWNSKLSPHMRILFSYTRLIALQEYFYDLLAWLVSAILLPLAIEAGAVGIYKGFQKRVLRVYLRWQYWLTMLIAAFAAFKISGFLLGWLPGKGVTGEVISVLVRLGVAYTVCILLWCFVQSLVSNYLADSSPTTQSEA